MVQLSTPCGDPYPGYGPPVRRFLSNYFDLLFLLIKPQWKALVKHFRIKRTCLLMPLFGFDGGFRNSWRSRA